MELTGKSDRKVARAALHYWEEPCISGKEGSGAVFFSGCALHCVFCQNQNIANGIAGKEISIGRLSEIFLELQEKGANNINLVTPGHFVRQITEALDLARQNGLHLPIVYNTSSYENVETIRMLDGYVDIYLPDYKYRSSRLSEKYSHAPDYPEVAAKAIAEMVRQTGTAEFAGEPGESLMRRGTIVRHLMLPGHLRDSKDVLKYLYETYGDTIYISIMNQLNRKVTEAEYEALLFYADTLGIENGFIQDGETAKESFIPEFDGEGV